jgi:hypothetical protein
VLKETLGPEAGPPTNQLNDECFIKTAVNQWVCETLYIDGGYHIID